MDILENVRIWFACKIRANWNGNNSWLCAQQISVIVAIKTIFHSRTGKKTSSPHAIHDKNDYFSHFNKSELISFLLIFRNKVFMAQLFFSFLLFSFRIMKFHSLPYFIFFLNKVEKSFL
jgi:hypothetical protein